ncbi:ABC transporter permease [Ekhidna sp.]|jgi:putative ABC transport system permease protein|uniref:ABC transporter permease n=1 Tax=Ekhidna sp. TaxID=2608089 RepID=UPI0032EADD08
MKHQPPKWALRFLEFFLRADYSDEIQGDITEAFYWRVQEEGLAKARFKFILEVFRSLKPTNLKSFYHLSLNTMIFRNYLKVAFRTLLKRKSTSFINIFGLSIGVAAFVFIFLYTYQIFTFDDHHQNKDRIFMAYKERITPDGTQATYDTWVPLKDRLISDYNQIEESSRYYTSSASIKKNNRYLEEEIVYTDPSLFKIFTFPVIHGNEAKLFPTKNSIVLNEKTANKYFDTSDAVGNYIEVFLQEEDTTLRYQVSAVIKNHPENASLQPTMLIPMESIPIYPELANSWNASFLETYVLLRDPSDALQLEADFPNLIESIWDKQVRENTNFKLLPIEEVYDTFFGDSANARTLMAIGIAILLIAIINFMNLSTAQATQRAKEVGLRKVLGAFQGQLRTQFITESFVMSFIATILGFLIVVFTINPFNQFFDLNIALSQFSGLEIIAASVALIISLGILSGSYPAFYLSSIGAIEVLRQKLGMNASTSFRNVLVVLQFAIALFLIASTIIVSKQINYMANKNMGFESEGILIINASPRSFTDRELAQTRLKSFKTELSNKSYINDISSSRSVPTSWTRSFVFVRPNDWEGDPLRMRYTYVDANFFDIYGIPVKNGRNFLSDSEGDQRGSVILNEAAMRAFEFSSEKENTIRIGDNEIIVVGIVEDFHFETLQNEVAPTLIFHRVADNLAAHNTITLRMDMNNLVERIEEIESMWNELGSTQEFSYSFMDDRVANLYEEENRYLGMVGLFSAVSIIIACLGLYGLTLFIIEKRRKEISIRKVLGAEINTILRLIFTDFTKWVAIAFIIAVPFAVYFLGEWLESYHYRIDISWITFVVALLIVLGLVILTVGYQSLRAASSNPVKYLKDE